MAEERVRHLELTVVRLEEQLKASEKALRLQAEEYERRLDVLNHAHEEAREVAAKTVNRKEFEDYVKATQMARDEAVRTEADKRELALQRVDEKFDDYVKRYEVRQREVDQALTTQKASAEAARQFAQEAVQKANRNIAALGVVLAVVIAVMNLAT